MSKYLIISNFTSGGKRYLKDSIIGGVFTKETETKLLNLDLIQILEGSQGLGTLEIASEVEVIETPSSNEEIIEENKNKKGNK